MSEDYSEKWGIYTWSPEHGDHYVKAEDLNRFRVLMPRGKVFYCIQECDGYLKLKYGDEVFMVKSGLFKVISDPEYYIGEVVEVDVGSSKGQHAVILSMDWHFQKNMVMYTLEVNGKKKSNRYWDEDIKKILAV